MNQTKNITIAGPHLLEGIVSTPQNPVRGLMLICHPHPLHQGTMHNKVVTTLARAANACDLINLRFNFRGVGKSEGTYADGIGELEDAKAALNYLRTLTDDETLPIFIAGFSFGGNIAIRLAAQINPAPAGLITIAPALHYENLPPIQPPTCPWLLVHGDQDDVIALPDNQNWVKQHAPATSLTIFEGTGHFFHGKLVQLQQTVVDFIRSN